MIYHIIIEGKDETQMQELFEEIQNKYSFYDNAVLEECQDEESIIDGKKKETGFLHL